MLESIPQTEPAAFAAERAEFYRQALDGELIYYLDSNEYDGFWVVVALNFFEQADALDYCGNQALSSCDTRRVS